MQSPHTGVCGMVNDFEDFKEFPYGYLPLYDENTKTKEGTIKEFSTLLENDISINLHELLPIIEWANYKHWVFFQLIQNEIIWILE